MSLTAWNDYAFEMHDAEAHEHEIVGSDHDREVESVREHPEREL